MTGPAPLRRLLARVLTGRRAGAPAPHGGRSPAGDDWRCGDLAECVHPGPWIEWRTNEPGSGPLRGEMRIVAGVRAGPGRLMLLVFARYPGRGYDADGFRKVTPRADPAEPAEAAGEWLPARELVP